MKLAHSSRSPVPELRAEEPWGQQDPGDGEAGLGFQVAAGTSGVSRMGDLNKRKPGPIR